MDQPRRISIRLRCAVCNRPVDGIEVDRDPIDRVTTLTARCHGAVDRMEVSDHQAARWSREEVLFWASVNMGEIEGVAFAGVAGLIGRAS